MSEMKITARERTAGRKGAVRQAREEGWIPAVIYGANEEPQSISISAHSLLLTQQQGGFYTKVHVLDVDGKDQKVLARDLQLHPVSDKVLHVDFMRYDAKRQVKVTVPVHVIGENDSPGLKIGGVLQLIRPEVQFLCRADSIPEFIEVSMAGKEIGGSTHISEVELPEGVTPVEQHDFTIASVVSTRTSKSADDEEAEGEEGAEATEGAAGEAKADSAEDGDDKAEKSE